MRDAVSTMSTRDAILDATDRLLTRFGYKKMTIDDLAAEVGIGKGSVYLHFESKEEIALSHVDRIVERLKRRLSEIASTNASAADRICQMLIERVLFRFDSVQHYTQSLNEMLSVLRPRLLDRRKKYFNEEAGIIADVIREGQKEGELAKGDPLDISLTLLSATNSLLPYSLSAYELGERDELKERTRKIADLLVKGLSLKETK
jgi:TetR/AcrR family fatty acid metabolism transcriptional regulator